MHNTIWSTLNNNHNSIWVIFESHNKIRPIKHPNRENRSRCTRGRQGREREASSTEDPPHRSGRRHCTRSTWSRTLQEPRTGTRIWKEDVKWLKSVDLQVKTGNSLTWRERWTRIQWRPEESDSNQRFREPRLSLGIVEWYYLPGHRKRLLRGHER